MRRPILFILFGALLSHSSLWAQAPLPTSPGTNGEQGFYTDPRTGITYRKTLRPVEQPVLDQKLTTKERIFTEPVLSTSYRTEQRTLFIPVTRYEWQTKWHGRWNPFTQPSLAYHQVPRTTWEPRVETVQVPVTETKWVQKTETVPVTENNLRIERRQEVVWERVNVPSSPINNMGPTAPQYLPSSQIAATPLAPPNVTIDSPDRSTFQRGLPATELGGPSNPGIIATAPAATMFR